MSGSLRPLRDFFVDLRRRKVVRAAIFYVVLAAGVVELADIVVPYTRLPAGTPGIVFNAAVIGFPVVLILAWVYDLTLSGMERTGDEPAAAAAPAATASETSAAAGTSAASETPAAPALAVLPFENVTGADEVEPLAAGLHGDLLTALSKVPGLTVISRRSVMGYRDTDKRPSEIARELDVGALLEGAVQSAAGRVRLNVQLIDARRETHRWAESYDRVLSPENIFQIQTELARRITDSLHGQLGTGAPAPGGPMYTAASPPTADLEAYRLYARGHEWIDQRTDDGLARAVDAFRRALDRDPDYALAWAGLAEAITLLGWYDYPEPDDAPDPEEAARRALDLDPTLAEARTSLGVLHCLRQDAPTAYEELRRAAELGPSYAEAHIWLAWVLLVLDRPADALHPARRALELNPLSPVVQLFAAETLLANGRAREARQHSRRAVELQDGFGLAHYMDALVAYHLGEIDTARRRADRALELIPSDSSSPRPTQARALLALLRVAAEESEAARAQLDTIRAASGPDDAFGEGLVLAALGDPDAAFAAFDRVERWGPLVSEEALHLFPDVLGPLRDQRFRDVRESIERSWKIRPAR